MSILEQIKSELPWLDNKVIFDLTRGKPSPDQLSVTEENFRSINCLLYTSDAADDP